MANTQQTPDDMPVIDRVSARIGTFERKMEHLEEKIAGGKGSEKSLDYDRTELKACRDAIRALKYHRAVIEGLPQPFSVLRDLVQLEPGEAGLKRLQAKARTVLEEFVGYDE